MTADQFVEFVASVPAEKQVGTYTKLGHLLEAALRIRLKRGINLDAASQIRQIASA